MVILPCKDLWFLQHTIRNKNVSLEVRIWRLCHFDLNVFAKLKSKNPGTGRTASSAAVFYDECNMDSGRLCSSCCRHRALIESTIFASSELAQGTVSSTLFMKHAHLLIVEAVIGMFSLHSVPRSLFAVFGLSVFVFCLSICFLRPQFNPLQNSLLWTILENKWAPLYWCWQLPFLVM